MSPQTLTLIASLSAAAMALASPLAGAQSGPPASSTEAGSAPATAPAGPTQPGGTMYRWVDKDNTVHYSDRPQPGAQAVPVQAPQTFSAPPPPAPSPVRTAPTATVPPAASCGITSPTQEQVFPNVQSVTISYRGPRGGQAELLLNGASRMTVPAGQAFTLAPIPRGTYSAAVSITADTGAPLCRTPPVTFHVLQPSVLSPVRQQMNRPQPRAN